MNESLSVFMKIALVAVVIVALLYNKLAPMMGEIADDVAEYIETSSSTTNERLIVYGKI